MEFSESQNWVKVDFDPGLDFWKSQTEYKNKKFLGYNCAWKGLNSTKMPQ